MFGFRNPVYETMTRYPYCGWVVRVWRDEQRYTKGPDPEVLELLNRTFVAGADHEAVSHAVGSLPRVSAIEILDPQGNGSVYYPDWK